MITPFILTTIVLAQQDCTETNYDACKQLSEDYKLKTCAPMKITNPQYYVQCICYQQVNYGYCYQQCPNNVTVQNELKNVIVPIINQACQVANMTPTALPTPAPWDKYIPAPKPVVVIPNTEPAPKQMSELPTPVKNQDTTVKQPAQVQNAGFISVGSALVNIAAAFIWMM
ncbi:hypothetical protein HDV02_005231 [Globomyces sp. JEL0801]|nr:hypothetical protein HDV02_005231 [Globomyces sp. JEL0801]